MAKGAIDRSLAALEAELSAVLQWEHLPKDLKDKLLARLLELKQEAAALQDSRRRSG